jgi:hypothetical protein
MGLDHYQPGMEEPILRPGTSLAKLWASPAMLYNRRYIDAPI